MPLTILRLAGSLAILAAAALLPRTAHAQSNPGGPPDGRGTTQTGATLVICGDGTSSTAGNDACARHGGIKAYPGARGPVNAALQMQDHASKWSKTLPPAAPVPAAPKADSVATTPDSTKARSPR